MHNICLKRKKNLVPSLNDNEITYSSPTVPHGVVYIGLSGFKCKFCAHNCMANTTL